MSCLLIYLTKIPALLSFFLNSTRCPVLSVFFIMSSTISWTVNFLILQFIFFPVLANKFIYWWFSYFVGLYRWGYLKGKFWFNFVYLVTLFLFQLHINKLIVILLYYDWYNIILFKIFRKVFAVTFYPSNSSNILSEKIITRLLPEMLEGLCLTWFK